MLWLKTMLSHHNMLLLASLFSQVLLLTIALVAFA
jgi:hypothetical protein